MDSALFLLLLVLAAAVIFDFINGFHDTANAIATVIATRVLAPWQAILMAAGLNFVGAFTGTAVAKTIGTGLIDPNAITQPAVFAALIGAISWNLLTWYYGIPSSSSHALIGGIVGAAISEAGWLAPFWDKIVERVVVPLLAAPTLGFLSALLLMLLITHGFRGASRHTVGVVFGRAQLLSSAWMAFSHGGNDAQKTMGVITIALVSYGALQSFEVPTWVILLAATAMGLGTAAGGWRIIRTMGVRVTQLRPVHGFSAETAAGTVIEVASRLGLPLSTTHVIGSSIMGVGAARGISYVRWNVAGDILTAWVLTLPAAALVAGVVYRVIALFGIR